MPSRFRFAPVCALTALAAAHPLAVRSQLATGLAVVDSAAVARSAWSKASAAFTAHDTAAAYRYATHAAAAWPVQPAYVWGRAVAAVLAADTAGAREALAEYAALGLGRDLRADARTVLRQARGKLACNGRGPRDPSKWPVLKLPD